MTRSQYGGVNYGTRYATLPPMLGHGTARGELGRFQQLYGKTIMARTGSETYKPSS